MSYRYIQVPQAGQKITVNREFRLSVPDQPIIPYIRGDGVGVDITPVMMAVVNAAVAQAYGAKRCIHWMKVYAGEEATAPHLYGPDNWLPDETLAALRTYVVSIKGPLAAPMTGSIRSLNVALRQELDLYVCLRPVRYLRGVPAPLSTSKKVDMVIFRENSEDIYAGIEYAADSSQAHALIKFLQTKLKTHAVRFPNTTAIGVKLSSQEGTQRLVRKAVQYAIDHDRATLTLVHKGNIMRYTEGGFRDWGYALLREEFGAQTIDEGPWCRFTNPKTGRIIVVKDMMVDAFLQQSLLRPSDFDVIATMNLNGDYISAMAAAMVGGIGITPGANLSDSVAIFEATHGTAPKYAGKDYVNPGSEILAAAMMLRHLGWVEAAHLILVGMEKAILEKHVTFDFARLMKGAQQVSCSGFGQVIIENMKEVRSLKFARAFP